MRRVAGGAHAPTIADTLLPGTGRGRSRWAPGWFLLMHGGDLLMHDGGTLGARSEVRAERHSGSCAVVLGDGRGGTAKAAAMLLTPQPRRPR